MMRYNAAMKEHDSLLESVNIRTVPGTRDKLRLLAALRKKPMGRVLAELVDEALKEEHKARIC
jgi:hypothetical protein